MKIKLFLVAILLTAVFCVSSTALAMTEAERQALIAQIQAQIAQLTQQLNVMLAQQQGTSTWCHTFNIDLDIGDTGSEVSALQTAFQEEGFIISASEIQNQQFGASTGQAVKDFKAKYSGQIITAGTTKVGAITRGMLNQLYGCISSAICTQDTKQCPDGSYVSRIPPDCDFKVCPTITACAPYWQCTDWNACVNGQQTKTCTDANNCGVTTDKPATTKSCAATTCNPYWQCGNWSTCVNGQQTKICTDTNNCGVTTDKPLTTRSCSISACVPVWSCSAWSGCVNGQKTKTCTDTNNCGTTTDKPAIIDSCSTITTVCTPYWQCGNWSTCANGQQTKTCTDLEGCGVTTDKPATTRSCSISTTCNPYWSCGSWSACVNGQKTKTCIDSNNCGTTLGKPPTTQSCVSTICAPFWSCGAWSACVNGTQTKTCTDTNYCGVTTDKPATTQSCTSTNCLPFWQCGSWSGCNLNQQTRTCVAINMVGCPVDNSTRLETQYCKNPGGNWGACQNVTVPGLTFSCIYGTAPYGVSGDFIISHEQFLSFQSTFGAQYISQQSLAESCGCSWITDASGAIYSKINCSTGLQCDPSKVPDKLTPGMFTDYCATPSPPDVVEWSSRISKGESIQGALQNTINSGKILNLIHYEKTCVQTKKYYIGGDAHSPNWMCDGDKYRLDPSTTAIKWQKWVNGAWTSNYSTTCQ